MAADYVNPTYDDIMDGNGEKSSYESLQKENRRRDLPVTPAESNSEYQEVTLSSANQEVVDSTQTKVLLKRYLTVVIVLSVLCVLLVLAVILVYLFLGRTIGCQTFHNQEQKITGCATEWETIEGQSSPGGLELVVSSVELCQSVCEGMYSCQAVDYSHSQRICWLHTLTINEKDKQRDATKTQYILITRCVQQVDHLMTSPTLNYTSTATSTAIPTTRIQSNDFMNELTLNNGDLYELRFDLEAFDGEKRYAKYQHFAVANETARYKLFLGTYSGNARDSFSNQANMKFSTFDNDNDRDSRNCAVLYTGGWWHRSCHSSMLTGIYGSTDNANGVNWSSFKGNRESLKYADMKVRPSSVVRNSCKALKESGISYNDVQNISLHIDANQPASIRVFCDQSTQGGGWMVILKRNYDESLDFNRNWADYRAGFGQIRGEYWFGLETLHKITSTVVIYELYIGLKTSDDFRYIIYSSFKVTAGSDYRLVLGPVKEGDLVDKLQDNNGQPFSTRDKDNDNWEQNCAQVNAGGWWYNSCTEALLTGRDHPGAPVEQRLRWKNWLGTGEEFPPIDEATMMIRPVD